MHFCFLVAFGKYLDEMHRAHGNSVLNGVFDLLPKDIKKCPQLKISFPLVFDSVTIILAYNNVV